MASWEEGKYSLKHLHYYEVSLKVESLGTPEACQSQTVYMLSLTVSIRTVVVTYLSIL